MENPNVEVEIKRDENGKVTGMSYKVSDPGEQGRRPLEFCEVLIEVFKSEGPEDHSTIGDVYLGE